jgi:hypothetical protein
MDTYTPHGAELGRVMAFIVGKPVEQQVEILVKELAAAFVAVHETLTHEARAEQKGFQNGEAAGAQSAKRSMNSSAAQFAMRMRKEGRTDAADAITEWIKTKTTHNKETGE